MGSGADSCADTGQSSVSAGPSQSVNISASIWPSMVHLTASLGSVL